MYSWSYYRTKFAADFEAVIAVSTGGAATNGDSFSSADKILQNKSKLPAMGRWLTFTSRAAEMIDLLNQAANAEFLAYCAPTFGGLDSDTFQELMVHGCCFDTSEPSFVILALMYLANHTTGEGSENFPLIAARLSNPHARVAYQFAAELGAFEKHMAGFVDGYSEIFPTLPLGHRMMEIMYFVRIGLTYFSEFRRDWKTLFPRSCELLPRQDRRAVELGLIDEAGDLIDFWGEKLNGLGEGAWTKSLAYLQGPLMRRTNAPVMLFDPCTGPHVAAALYAFLHGDDSVPACDDPPLPRDQDTPWSPTDPDEPFPGTSGDDLRSAIFEAYHDDPSVGEGILRSLGLVGDDDDLMAELEDLVHGAIDDILLVKGLPRDAKLVDYYPECLQRFPRLTESVEVMTRHVAIVTTGVEAVFSDTNNQLAPNQAVTTTSNRVVFRQNIRGAVMADIKRTKAQIYKDKLAASGEERLANAVVIAGELHKPPRRERSKESYFELTRQVHAQSLLLPTDAAALKEAGPRAQHKKRDARRISVPQALTKQAAHRANKRKQIGLKQLRKATASIIEANLAGKSAVHKPLISEFRKLAKKVRAKDAKALLACCSDDLKNGIKLKFDKVELDKAGLAHVKYNRTDDDDDEEGSFCLLDLVEEYFRLGGPVPAAPGQQAAGAGSQGKKRKNKDKDKDD
jgi:hypothetical protein